MVLFVNIADLLRFMLTDLPTYICSDDVCQGALQLPVLLFVCICLFVDEITDKKKSIFFSQTLLFHQERLCNMTRRTMMMKIIGLSPPRILNLDILMAYC